MSLAHQVFDQSVRPLPRSERFRLAALILEDLADDGDVAGMSDEVEDAETRARAERITPRSADLERLIASGMRSDARHEGESGDESVEVLLRRSGLIGCLVGEPGSPRDLSTNPVHMEGFGHDTASDR